MQQQQACLQQQRPVPPDICQPQNLLIVAQSNVS
jgi:hypothetical protein